MSNTNNLWKCIEIFLFFESKAEMEEKLDAFMNMSVLEKRAKNPNARDDDEYAAIELYDLDEQEAISKANKILKSNPLNIEARLLKAGYEYDIEKHIDLLQDIIYNNSVNVDEISNSPVERWWKDSSTRPYMRAKLALGCAYVAIFFGLECISMTSQVAIR